jgi:hypothetical protein
MPGLYERYRDREHEREPDLAQQFGNYRSSPAWREQDYDDRRGLSQRRGRYADPKDQGHGSRDRWDGSGGSRWDENDRTAITDADALI